MVRGDVLTEYVNTSEATQKMYEECAKMGVLPK